MDSLTDIQRLAASFERDSALTSILETIVDALIIINENGRICHTNPAVERILGYSRNELLGCNVSKLMPSPYQDEHDQYLANYLLSGVPKVIGIGREVFAKRHDGEVIPIDLTVSEFQFEGRRFFTGIIRDVSERVASEEQLRRERDFSRSLIDTASAIILVLSPTGNIERFNPFLEELSGYTLDEVVGKNWFDVFIPGHLASEVQNLFDETLAGTPVINHINPIVTKDGRERIITWSGRRLMNLAGDVVGILAIGNDITDLKRAEQRLVQSERLAAIGEMVTGLAHESRNALQRSQACLEILELDLAEQADKIDLIHRIQRAMTELGRLYEEVRSYAAPIQLDLEEVVVSQLISEVWEDLGLEQKKELRCTISGEGLHQHVRADRARLTQVFRNILENGIVVSPVKSQLEIRIERAAFREFPSLGIRFRDQGPGLNEEQQRRIFEPFYTTKTRGTGLGMAICRRIVETHHGEITAQNHAQGGAVIEVKIPIFRSDSALPPE